MLCEYPEFAEEEFFNLEPTTLIEIKDTVYFAVELLEPQIYYWDCVIKINMYTLFINLLC